ncbi:MAG: O-antigen ligase family protein [Chitinophagaceae bacterium]|nr:O-antigen ligase family protein [Chitinophagaceae bacterium]
MPNKLQNDRRSLLFLFLFTAMLLSLFFSRAALSVSIGAFVVCSFLHTGFKKQWQVFFSTPLLWSMSLLFLLPLLSGLWSEDKLTWQHLVLIKIPLLALPLAFAGPLPQRLPALFAYIFIGVLTIAAGWSAWHYLSDPEAIADSYLRAKTIITPLQNDHVRFSWLISAAILAAGWLFLQQQKKRNATGITLAAVIAFLIIYLHMLAVRTGLLCFYSILAGFIISQIVQRRRVAFFLLGAIIVLPVLAWVCFPTFQNRLRYFKYDMSYFRKLEYLPGGNDAMRIISMKAGWEVLAAHPLSGVGFGDIKKETDLRYEAAYPGMLETDKIYPSSEIMVYGAGSGVAGLLVIVFALTAPFFTPVKNNLPWRLLAVMTGVVLLFDVGLEVQFGVFLHAFTLLWCWKWWQGQNLVTP